MNYGAMPSRIAAPTRSSESQGTGTRSASQSRTSSLGVAGAPTAAVARAAIDHIIPANARPMHRTPHMKRPASQ